MNEWLYDEGDEAVFCQETGAEVARVIHGTTDNGRVLTDDEVDAAGRLIAAAPELLRELKRLVTQFNEAVGYIPQYMALADDAVAAIAKAEGRDTPA